MDRLPTRYPNPSANNSLNQTASIKALSSTKYQSVGIQDDLKSADLNKSRKIRESNKSSHQTQVSYIRVRIQIEG